MTTEKKGKMGPMNATTAEEEEETLYSLSLSLPLGLDPTRETMKRATKPFVARRFQANRWLTPQRVSPARQSGITNCVGVACSTDCPLINIGIP